MSARPDLVRLKYSSDGDASIRAAIATGGTDPIQTGELVVGVEQYRVILYSKDASGRIVNAVAGPNYPTEIDGGDFDTSFPVLNIGDPYGGGYYAGLISYAQNGTADYALIVAPKEGGESSGVAWYSGPTAPTVDLVPSEYDGYANSEIINSPNFNHAYFCRSLSIGGYTDWYLPAWHELDIIYTNLKPTLDANIANSATYGHSWTNTSAITDPPENGFTTTNPAQTGALLFQEGGSEAFDDASYYMTSTMKTGTNNPYGIRFQDGRNPAFAYYANYRHRAIRKIAL